MHLLVTDLHLSVGGSFYGNICSKKRCQEKLVQCQCTCAWTRFKPALTATPNFFHALQGAGSQRKVQHRDFYNIHKVGAQSDCCFCCLLPAAMAIILLSAWGWHRHWTSASGGDQMPMWRRHRHWTSASDGDQMPMWRRNLTVLFGHLVEKLGNLRILPTPSAQASPSPPPQLTFLDPLKGNWELRTMPNSSSFSTQIPVIVLVECCLHLSKVLH